MMKNFQQTINEVEEESDHEYQQYLNFFNEYSNNEIVEDPLLLQKEYEAESQNASAQQYQPIVLVPMNEYQLALIYVDKYPLLRFRKFVLLLTLNIQKICLFVLQSYYFQILNLLVILMNSVLIAIKYYSLPIERLFLYFYTFEVVITFSGQGFVKYSTELWNILDLAVIISAYLYIEDGMNVDLTSLRIFKIIKQINMFSHIIVLNKILRSLLLSLLQLKDAFVFLLLSYSIFAIVGLQLFSGILKYRCIYEETGIVVNQDICSVCYDPQFICAKTNENPHLNQISFDSFGWALLQVFIGTTMEGWSRIMDYLIQATSYASSIYFLLIILMGGYFLVNLTLAVIKLNFSHYQTVETVQKEDTIYNYRELRKLNIYIPERVQIANKQLQMAKQKRHLRKSKTMLHTNNQEFQEFKKSTNKARVHPKEPSIQINRVYVEKVKKNDDQRLSTQKFLPLHRLSVGSNVIQVSPRFIRDIDISPNNSKLSVAADPKSFQSNSSIKQQDQQLVPPKQPSPRTSIQKNKIQMPDQVPILTIKTQSVSLEQQKLKTKLFLTQFYVKLSDNIYQPTSMGDILLPKTVKQSQVDVKKYKKENQILYYKFRNQTTLMTGSYAHNSYPTQSSWIQKSKSLNNTLMKRSIINKKKTSVPRVNQYSYLIRKMNKELQEDYVIEDEQPHLKQEYLKIKNQKSLEIEASLEDVLTISDFLLDDQKFINHMNNILRSLNYTQGQYDIWLPGFNGKLKTYQKITRQIMESQIVNRLMNLIVLGNTIVLALVGIVDDNSLDNLNLIFVIIFTIELGLKLISYGVVGYFKDKMNSFDAIIVAISLIEILETNESGKSSFSVFRSVRIFRALRVLRISKLIRSLKFMEFLIKVLSNAQEQILYLLFLLGLLLYTYSLLGMSLFDSSIDHVSEETRDSFSTLNGSFMIAFQIMTITNWYDVLYELLQSENAYILSLPYLVSLIILGNYVFLNLLLAVVLDNFEQEYRSDKKQINNKIIIAQDKIFLENINPLSPKSRRSSLNSIIVPNQLFQQVNFVYFVEQGIADHSLWIFSQENVIRRLCYRIIKDSKFEYFTLFMIVISSIKLVLDTYTINYQIAFYIDVIVVSYFLIEGTMKIIALGFVLDKNSYLRDYWNAFDFCIITTSFIDILVSSVDLRVIKILRLFRTLRPLRFITQNRSLKVLVSALLQSTDGIINVGLVIILTWMIFAIIGINFMSGKMQYCDTGDYNYLNQSQCPGEWKNHETNFDNIFSGMLTLFILSTLVSWPYYCLYFRDGTENGPVQDANPGMFWFFAAFILLCSILLINLFIGVILVNFHIAEENSKAQYLTQEQHYWIQTQKLITDYKPNFNLYYKPQNKIRGILFQIVKFSYFELIISLNIIASIIVTALYYDDSGTSYNTQLDTMSLTFSIVLLLEATIKIIAYSPQGYFRSQLNWLDFIISVFSVLDFLVNISQGQVVKIFRVLRVIRILRLVRAIKGLKKLIDTAMYSLPAILNAAILYFLFHSIFSILGVFLFQTIRGHGIDELTNFSDFHHSFILLFRSQTGEEWYEMMFDTMHSGWYSSLFWIAFMIVQKFVMLNLFILIILDQYDRNYFQEDNPFNRFSELENIFIESWTKYSIDGQLIDKDLMLKMVLEMKEPLGFDADKVIQTQINEWKKNNPLRKTSIKEELKLKLRGQMLTQVMMRIYEMELFCDHQGRINYKQVFFKLIKTSYLKKIIDNINSRGVSTLKKKEEESMGIIMQDFIIDEEQQVNPLVCHFYSKMAFNCLKIYSLKYIHKIRANRDFINFDSSEYSFEEESDSSSSEEYVTRRKIEEIPKFCKVPDNSYYLI